MQIPVSLLIDLSPIGGTEVAASGYLDIDRGCDPNLLVVDFDEIGTTPHSVIMGILPQEIVPQIVVGGRTAQGETFAASIQLQISATTSNSSGPRATFILGDYSITPKTSSHDVVEWRYPLYNWAVHRCDISTVHDDGRSFKLDRIQFAINHRIWTVVDHTIGNREGVSKADHNHPLKTASLIVPALADDPEDSAREAADIVCLLLSFALGRRINWVAAVGYAADHQEVTSSVWSRVLEPYNAHGLCPIDNFNSGVLRSFIEPAFCEVIKDLSWWRLTLGYYIGTKSRQFVDVRSIILYMLLDRIANRVLPGNWGPRFARENDALFSDSFASALTGLFSGSIPNWNYVDTNDLLGVVKQWNQSPSYPVKIREACAALDLPAPSRAILAQRHKVLHTGRVDSNSLDMREIWLKADWIVLSMLLRLFGYTGQVFHPISGANPLPLVEALARLADENGVYEK